VEQTERFAGSLGDPARMVANYAGVMAGNDSRNDIVVRGNSPLGILWRLEGVEIPNPNHFGAQSTTGGAVSMLNSNLLVRSDFLTGAFPAEFGNAVAGVFDLNLRSGNKNKYEFTGQVGFNGFEAAAEGPFQLEKSALKGSFLFDYRYSTLDLVSKMGFDLGTGTAIPEYQDFCLLIDLPTRNTGRFKLVALTGKSQIRLGRDFDASTGVAHSDFGSATDFDAGLVFTALIHQYFIDENTPVKSALSYNYSASGTVYDSVDYINKSYFTIYEGQLSESKYTFNTGGKHRFTPKQFLTGGIIIDVFSTNYSDSSWVREYNRRISVHKVDNRYSSLLRGHIGYQHRFSDDMVLNAGLYSQHYSLNSETTFEPRLSMSVQLDGGQQLSVGYGLHSQIQPRVVYYQQSYDKTNGTYNETSLHLQSTKAHHLVLGYEKRLGNNSRIKVETYYQKLYDVPVSKTDGSYSLLNQGAEYHLSTPDSMINAGFGRNYGVELTLEQFLNKGYYFLLTVSLFDSKYQGYDGIWRNTAFNTNYIMNVLGGYEWKLGTNNFITFDLKTVWTGGRRTSPIDLAASMEKGQTVYNTTQLYELRFKDYFRIDFRIGYRLNGKHITQEWGLDLQNVTNHENIYSETYNPFSRQAATTYQQGFTPMMLYRINF
jgi:hypothetical protein